MPRLRAARTKEEAAQVPADEPISIEITEGEEPAALPIPEKAEPPPLKTESKPLRDIAGDTPIEIAPEPEPEPQEPQKDETEALKKRLQELESAEQLRVREMEELRRFAQTRETELQQSRNDALQRQWESVSNGLAAAQAESESAQRDWEAAAVEGDHKKQSDANVRINRAQARLIQYEDAKSALENHIEELKKAPPQQQRPTDPIERAIAGLPDAGKNWLRAHPEYLTDQRKNSHIVYLHHEAVSEGKQPFSAPYFEWIETKLGMRQAPKADDVADRDPPPQRERAIVSAPVSRESPSLRDGRPTTTRITLSPEQREMARISGVTEIEYAKQLVRLQQAKKDGRIQ